LLVVLVYKAYLDNAVGRAVGIRVHDYRVKDAEDGGGGRASEREGEYGGGGKAGTRLELAQRVTQILKQGFHATVLEKLRFLQK